MNDPINKLPLPDLFAKLNDERVLAALIDVARREDLGERGDITTQLSIDPAKQGAAQFRSRQAGRLAGAILLPRIAAAYDAALSIEAQAADGETLSPGQTIATVTGPLASILTAERVMLNFLTHLSGIATLTDRYVQQVAGTHAKIYDTRKTIPGFRELAKYAVRCGGGFCHRIGLYDAVLVKDNHISDMTGSLADRIADLLKAARRLPGLRGSGFVEVEVDSLEQLKQVLPLGCDIVLLDNMAPEVLRQAVAMRDRLALAVRLEASGGVNLDTVAAIARAGVDRIAIGALTHSAPALDIGLDIE